MKSNIKKVYIVELILLIYAIVFKFFLVDYTWGYLVNLIFLLIFFIGLFFTLGFPKDKHYFKKNTIQMIVIVLLLYFLISYLFGLFTGFKTTYYSHQIGDVLKFVVPIGINITLLELIRYIILKKEPNRFQKILLVFLMVSLNTIMSINNFRFDTTERIFLFASTFLMPLIARECLYTYMTANISFVPSLLFHLVTELYIYIVPILPDLGNYLSSVIGIMLPYIVYVQIKRELKYREKYNSYATKVFSKFALFVLIGFLSVIVILVSGLFKYQMIAIASNSMHPVYSRGDAVIIEKIDYKEVEEGNILVFKVNNSIVTHRVIEIKENGNEYIFVTKGDNNTDIDSFPVTKDEVVGVVRNVVKYVGFPTIWLSELNK